VRVVQMWSGRSCRVSKTRERGAARRPVEAVVSDGERGAQMGRSVLAALRGRGIPPVEAEVVLEALRLAMEPRTRLLDDDHHPSFLHPGRSVLVILHDVQEPAGANSLALAALHESRDDRLRVGTADVERILGVELAGALEELPRPGWEDLAERLVLLERGPALAVLAEHLDHLRHLHLRHDLVMERASVYEEVAEVWGPFAQRTEPRMGVRFAHWLRTFRKRL